MISIDEALGVQVTGETDEMTGCTLLAAFAAVAMPTKKELAAATFVGLRKSRAEMRVAQAKDHLMPKAETEKAADAKSAAAPSGCAFKINGNTATMVFPNGNTIEFVKCPAGEFEMLCDYEKTKTTKVRITRPFWFSKSYLKIEQVKFMPGAVRGWHNAFHYDSLDANNQSLFPRLTADLKSFFPKGYVTHPELEDAVEGFLQTESNPDSRKKQIMDAFNAIAGFMI